jgi:hypothetical protein
MAIIGEFSTLEQARRAVDAVIAEGVEPGAVTARTREGQVANLTTSGSERLGEIVMAAGIGALLGAAAAWAVGAPIFGGAFLGGFAGALFRMGVFNRRDGAHRAERSAAGQYVVVVDTDRAGSISRARTALMNAGAENVRTTTDDAA